MGFGTTLAAVACTTGAFMTASGAAGGSSTWHPKSIPDLRVLAVSGSLIGAAALSPTPADPSTSMKSAAADATPPVSSNSINSAAAVTLSGVPNRFVTAGFGAPRAAFAVAALRVASLHAPSSESATTAATCGRAEAVATAVVALTVSAAAAAAATVAAESVASAVSAANEAATGAASGEPRVDLGFAAPRAGVDCATGVDAFSGIGRNTEPAAFGVSVTATGGAGLPLASDAVRVLAAGGGAAAAAADAAAAAAVAVAAAYGMQQGELRA